MSAGGLLRSSQRITRCARHPEYGKKTTRANWCDEAGSVLCWGRYDWKKLPKPVNKAEWCNMAPKRACARENEAYPSGSERSLSRTCMFLISVTVVPSVGSKRGSWEGRVQEGVVG